MVGFSTTNFTRAWEPTLSWNQLRSEPGRECNGELDRRRLVTLGIAARYGPVLVGGCGVPEHCGPHCGSAVCAILLLTGGYITYPKSNNEVRIVSLGHP